MKISRKTLITLVGSIVLSMSLVAVYAQQQSSEASKASDAHGRRSSSPMVTTPPLISRRTRNFSVMRISVWPRQVSKQMPFEKRYRQGNVTLDLYVGRITAKSGFDTRVCKCNGPS